VGIDQAYDGAGGWIALLTAEGELLGGKARRIMGARESDSGVIRGVGLDNNLATVDASPCPTSNLGEELEGTLSRSEVG
jgi:hypothetical protein